jgi:hypothetical protein
MGTLKVAGTVESNWERFGSKCHEPTRSYLRVSLNKRGIILLNTFAVDKLGNPQAVIMHYDRTNSRIGLEPAEPSVQESFLVTRRRGRAYGKICANAFCKYFRIKTHGTMIFEDAYIDDNNKMLILDLAGVRELRRKTNQH